MKDGEGWTSIYGTFLIKHLPGHQFSLNITYAHVPGESGTRTLLEQSS